jgi:hypothetical protein
MTELRPQRAAILARDAAHARLRHLTVAAVAFATAIAGTVGGVAASSTHARAVARIALRPGSATSILPVPAPVPTTPVAGAPQPESASPVASAAPPVVVSGGS